MVLDVRSVTLIQSNSKDFGDSSTNESDPWLNLVPFVEGVTKVREGFGADTDILF